LIGFKFKNFGRFEAVFEKSVVRKFLYDVGADAKDAFKSGIKGGHSGRTYRRRGKSHQASSNGEYPANDTGRLLRSISSSISPMEVTIGSNVPHSKFLHGTSRMAKRKMSDDALKEAMKTASFKENFAQWKKK
jgi:hypothetical protein